MNFNATIRTFAIALGLTVAAADAESYFMKLKGQKSGEIRGGVTQKGRENQIQVLKVEHAIVSPRDAQSGLPTGQRLHKPMVVTIPLDKSAPLLYNALCTNENISEMHLFFWAPNLKAAAGVGSEVMEYSIWLTNANIASIEEITTTDANGLNPKQALKISFTYQKIQWTWTDGGITAMDDWESRT